MKPIYLRFRHCLFFIVCLHSIFWQRFYESGRWQHREKARLRNCFIVVGWFFCLKKGHKTLLMGGEGELLYFCPPPFSRLRPGRHVITKDLMVFLWLFLFGALLLGPILMDVVYSQGCVLDRRMRMSFKKKKRERMREREKYRYKRNEKKIGDRMYEKKKYSWIVFYQKIFSMIYRWLERSTLKRTSN